MRFTEAATATLDRQVGVITRRQLRDCGHADSQIDGLLRRGQLVAVDHGVYRRTGSGRPPDQDAVAALLRCGPGARLTGARVLGYVGVEGFGLADDFTVLVPTRRRVERAGFGVRRDRAPDRHGASYGPVAATTPARAFVEFAARPGLGDDALLRVWDLVRWRGVADRVRVDAVVADLGRHPGAVRLRRLLVTPAATVESRPERWLERELASFEPPLEWQAWLAPDLRVDAVWRDVALVVEYQGATTHDDVRDRADDSERHGRLRAMGYEVVVVDRHDLRRPDALRARLVAARQERSRRLAALTP